MIIFPCNNKSIFITTLIFIGFNDCMEAKRSNLIVYYSRQLKKRRDHFFLYINIINMFFYVLLTEMLRQDDNDYSSVQDGVFILCNLDSNDQMYLFSFLFLFLFFFCFCFYISSDEYH
jgi:hypothetical protein